MKAKAAEKPVNVEKLINQAVDRAVKATVLIGIEQGKAETKNIFKQTEARLYAFPELRSNIEKYNKDINDLRREDPGRSKDIVFFSTHGGGVRLSAEEIQEGRILVIQKKIYRDQTEIDEIEFSLAAVEDDEYYPVIEMKYFKKKTDEEISYQLHCDPSTVRRNKNRLVKRIAVKLYGARAVV